MGDESSPASATAAPAARQQTTQDLLADIFGSNDDELAASPAAATPSSNVNDIMGLFGQTSLSPQPTGASTSSYTAPSASADLFSSLSSTPPVVASPPPVNNVPAPPTAHDAYSNNGLKITLTPIRDVNNKLVVNILAKFTSTQPVSNVNFQAAVPKTQKLQMLAMSKTDVAPGATETQQLRVMVAQPGVRCPSHRI